MDVAQSVNKNQSLNYEHYDVSLVPSSTTMQYDLGYNLAWDEKTDEGEAKWVLRMMTSYLQHPEHSQDKASELTHMLSLRWWFKAEPYTK